MRVETKWIIGYLQAGRVRWQIEGIWTSECMSLRGSVAFWLSRVGVGKGGERPLTEWSGGGDISCLAWWGRMIESRW